MMRSRGLAWLEFLRLVRGPLPLGALLFAFLATLAPHAPPAELAARAGVPGWGLQREAVWSAALLFLGPGALLVLGGVLGRWRRGEADWIGSRPVGRLAALACAWLGATGGLVATCALVALGTELVAGDGARAATTRLVARVDLADTVRLEPGQTWRTKLDVRGLDAGYVRVRLVPTAGGAPTTDARLTVRAGGTSFVAEEHVTARRWIEARLPQHAGEVLVTLENRGAGELALLAGGGLEVWRPGGSALFGAVALAARTALALAALGALALGLGAWVSRPTAAGFAGAAWVGAVAWLDAPAWFPGADLPRALAIVGEGRLPGGPGPDALLGAALVCAAGLALGRLGLRSWRHSS
jgi:hypothetical protein